MGKAILQAKTLNALETAKRVIGGEEVTAEEIGDMKNVIDNYLDSLREAVEDE
jgi:hypothetical protein